MRHSIFIRGAAALAVVAAGGATSANAAAPTTAGKGTSLSFSADAVGPPVNGRIPSSLTFTAPGFTFDSRAVGKRCTHERAVLNECPSQSRLGAGTLGIHVVTPKFTRDTNIPINLYAAAGKSVLAIAFVGGPHVVPATISTSQGVTLSFNPLPKPPAFPSTTLTLNSVSIKLGTSRMVVTKKRRRVHGKHKFKTVITRTRYYLIHDPAACSGTVTSSVGLGFADGTSVTLTAPMACQ